MATEKSVFISIVELEYIRAALDHEAGCYAEPKHSAAKQLLYKLSKLKPQFGLQIIADPSEAK